MSSEKYQIAIKDLFLEVKKVKKVEIPQKFKSNILISFIKSLKPHTFKSIINLNWLPLNTYLARFVTYYKQYYQIQNLKRTDSTLKNQFKELIENTSYYLIKFNDNATYKIVVFE